MVKVGRGGEEGGGPEAGPGRDGAEAGRERGAAAGPGEEITRVTTVNKTDEMQRITFRSGENRADSTMRTI